jgi:hypothetical protein
MPATCPVCPRKSGAPLAMIDTTRTFPRFSPAGSVFLVLGAAGMAIVVGALIGNPTPTGTLLLAALIWLAAQGLVLYRPFVAFLILCGAPFLLACVAVTENRYINAFDVLVPAAFALGYLGRPRHEALEADARLTNPAHQAIAESARKFQRAAVMYLILVLVSLIPMAIRLGSSPAFEVLLYISRVVEGALIYPLALWWLRSEQRVHRAIAAVLVAAMLLAILNTYQVFGMGTFRAGITWVVNHLDWPVECPNDAAAGLVFVWVLILVRHQLKSTFWTYPMLAAVLFVLALTQSRSGLLTLVFFVVLSSRGTRWKYLLIVALFVPIVLALAPEAFFRRMGDTLTFKKGSFDVYSMMVRVYGYQSAWRVFTHNWLFGVGFLGCRYVSQAYNDLGLTNLGSENLYLETASGLGVVGLAALAYLYVRLFQLWRTALRVTAPGTLGHAIARFHMPLIVGFSIPFYLTGGGPFGVTATGQIGLWCAILVRSAHLAVERAEREVHPPS